MHSLKPFTFTLNLLLLLLSLSTLKSLVDANIEQVTLDDKSSLSHNNNNSFASESDKEDILKSSCTIESQITAYNFTYLMKFKLKTYEGDTDHAYVNATPDTGSDLIWFHGRACKFLDCYCYNKVECIKKPMEPIECEDPKCEALEKIKINHECDQENDKNLCRYHGLKYEDKTETKGFFGKGNFEFAISKSVKTNSINKKKLRIGFSTSKKDENVPERNGIVGLALGELSLINQYTGITKNFSYYLPQFRRRDEKIMIDRSKFKFGCGVEISEKNTTLLTKLNKYPICNRRYCVELKSICLKFKDESCENHKIKVSDDDIDHDKIIIIDSGTTFTFLKNKIFQPFLEEVKNKLEDKNPRKISFYKNCFEKKNGNVEKLENISIEFSGTTIELKRENFFDYHSFEESNGDKKEYVCLTIEGIKENEDYHRRLRNYGNLNVKPQLLGSRAQMDFVVAFSLGKDKKVSFENLEKLPDPGSVEKVSLKNNEKIPVLSE